MLKLLLASLISLFLIAEPVSAAGAGAGAQASSAQAKRQLAKKKVARKTTARAGSKAQRKRGREQAQVIAADNRQRMVRRVETVRGKRRVSYHLARRAAPALLAIPAMRTAGDMAGLNQTRDPLSLRSNVALVLDQNSSEVLFEKNANVALPIASITKLMTGLIVVESKQNLNETLTVTNDDVDRHKFSSSRLPVGARMTRNNLLHIALMSSENRAAAALGRNYPGGVQAFVAAMNAKARELGMNDTLCRFERPVEPERVERARPGQAGRLRTPEAAAAPILDRSELGGRGQRPPDALQQYELPGGAAGLEHRPAEDRLHQRSGALPGDAGDDPGPQRDHGLPRFEGQDVAYRGRGPHAALARGADAGQHRAASPCRALGGSGCGGSGARRIHQRGGADDPLSISLE
jgi:hypothetical protein